MSNWVFKVVSEYKNGSVHGTDLLLPHKYHVKGLIHGRLEIKACQHIVLGIVGESVSRSRVSNVSQFDKNLRFLLCFGYPRL